MPSPAKENYLKALYFLEEADGRITVTDLSKRLEVSKPTASHMVKSMQEQGWVVYQKYQPLHLTEQGRTAAALIIRKHRLTEMFLHQIMGFGWEEVHEIAEQIEHIDSDKLFARMDDMLGHPAYDPHGSPIPDREGNVVKPDLPALIDLAPGKTSTLKALGQSSTELLHYLNQSNIALGVSIQLIEVEPFDRSCRIRVGDDPPMTVSREVAECLLMEGE